MSCIEWHLSRNPKGYGYRYFGGRTIPAHRAAWIEAHGPIPDGLWVLHKCDNPPCVNLEHLYLGTHADNTRDMVERNRKRPPSCVRGHEFNEENTYVASTGRRRCRACDRIRYAARQDPDRMPPPAERTHCPSGHPYDEANTSRLSNGERRCKTCGRERARRAREGRAA